MQHAGKCKIESTITLYIYSYVLHIALMHYNSD